MRRFDKNKNMVKVNLLVEQRYLESKGLIKVSTPKSPVIEQFIKSYKLLLEISFTDSPDEDLPGGKRTIIFNKEDKYPSPEGQTHGLLSHAIKHFLEFDPSYVSSLLDKIANGIREKADEIYLVDKTGNIVADGDKAKKEINNNVMLNTLDHIQDKVKNNKELVDIEKTIYGLIEEMGKKYFELVSQKMEKSVDIDNGDDVATDALKNNKSVKFKGGYGGKDYDYYLDPQDASIVASDNDNISTLFRIDKKGNDTSKLTKYFSRGTEIYNDKLKSALNL